MTRKLSTSAAEVLLKLTAPRRGKLHWNAKDGEALYESRALTELVCRRLTRYGYLAESHTDGCIVYTVNKAGTAKALELRLHR